MNYTYDFAKWHKRTFGTEITREQHRIIASLEHFRQRGITRRVLVHDDGSRGDLIRRTLVLYFEWLTTRVFPLLTAAVMAQSMKTLREVMPEYHRFNPYNFNRSTIRLSSRTSVNIRGATCELGLMLDADRFNQRHTIKENSFTHDPYTILERDFRAFSATLPLAIEDVPCAMLVIHGNFMKKTPRRRFHPLIEHWLCGRESDFELIFPDLDPEFLDALSPRLNGPPPRKIPQRKEYLNIFFIDVRSIERSAGLTERDRAALLAFPDW